MPTLESMNIPTPKNWDEFESICLSSFKIRWNSPNLSKNGRHGQAQHGVDIFGVDDLGNQIGIQCKKYEGVLNQKIIEAEIENAMQFEPAIKSFYFATTAPPDAKIQRYIRIVSEQRKSENKFSLGIFFWDDIVQELATNESIFKKHFPQLELKGINNHKKTIALFDLAYRGLGFKVNLDLILGEMSEDLGQVLTMCTMVESAACRIISDTELESLVDDINNVRDNVNFWLDGNEINEDHILLLQNIGNQVVQKVSAVQYDLEKYDLATFTLGSRIVDWDFSQTTGKQFDAKFITEMLEKIFNCVPAELLQMIDACKVDDSAMKANYPHKFFVLCKKHFIRMQLPD